MSAKSRSVPRSLDFSDSRFAIDSPLARLALRASVAVRSGILPAQCDSRLSTGFSLIEILVVTVILAVVAATVTLALAGAGGERQLARDADRIAALVGYACEQAELSGRDIGLSLSSSGYRFSRSEHTDWRLLSDGELRPRKWSTSPAIELTRDGNRVGVSDEFPDKPQLACFSSGELTAFRLELALPDAAVRYRIEAAPDGEVVTRSIDSRGR